MVLSPKNFFTPFSPKMFFSRKLLNKKIFKTSFPIKKGYIHFRHQTPTNGSLRFLRKLQLFLKKLLNHQIFSTSFVIKKVMLIFGARHLLSLKNCQMCSQNSFSQFSQKILLFSKKLSNKKIFSISFLIEKVTFIFGVRWPLTGRTMTHWLCCKQSKGWRGNPYFYIPKYLSCDAPQRQRFLTSHAIEISEHNSKLPHQTLRPVYQWFSLENHWDSHKLWSIPLFDIKIVPFSRYALWTLPWTTTEVLTIAHVTNTFIDRGGIED